MLPREADLNVPAGIIRVQEGGRFTAGAFAHGCEPFVRCESRQSGTSGPLARAQKEVPTQRLEALSRLCSSSRRIPFGMQTHQSLCRDSRFEQLVLTLNMPL